MGRYGNTAIASRGPMVQRGNGSIAITPHKTPLLLTIWVTMYYVPDVLWRGFVVWVLAGAPAWRTVAVEVDFETRDSLPFPLFCDATRVTGSSKRCSSCVSVAPPRRRS